MTVETFGRHLALGATGLLRAFNEAGVLDSADVHVATRLGAVLEEPRESVLLAAALAVAAVRRGSICVDLTRIADVPRDVPEDEAPVELAWPELAGWLEELVESPLITERALRLEGPLLYLDRYWREEGQVCDDIVARLRQPAPTVDQAVLTAGVDRVFPAEGYEEQRVAVQTSVRRWTTILTGGPGTGKTTTVAGLLALICEQHEQATGRPPRIALSAPTGKAAARLQEAVDEVAAALPDPVDRARVSGLTAQTLHRLLGWRRGTMVRFRHHRTHRLPYDVVVVDETSMVSLTMMARLLEALRPETRLILVGDPDQLSSVEAGAVLADLVAGLAEIPDSPVSALRRTHRYGEHIGALAQALRDADADRVLALLGSGSEEVVLIDPDDPDDEAAVAAFTEDVVDTATAMREAADRGDAETALECLSRHRLLCAHREGPFGVGGWNRRIQREVAERTGITEYDDWFSGRPVLVTANDKGQRLSNGDMGVTVRRGDRLRVVLADRERREFAPTRLPEVQTVHAMTVHKAQGSQARVVSVVMPPPESRLLTRELFYTAVTRAQEQVRVIGSVEAIRAAVGREVQRASGLRERLSAALSP